MKARVIHARCSVRSFNKKSAVFTGTFFIIVISQLLFADINFEGITFYIFLIFIPG
jgi:hypothetical protein